MCIKLFQFLYTFLCKIGNDLILKVSFWETDCFFAIFKLEICHWLFTSLRGEIARWNCILFHWLWPMVLAGWLGTWKGHDCKIVEKEILGKRNVSRPLWMSKKLDIIVSHECSPKGDFKRTIIIKWMGRPISLFPYPSLSSLMNSWTKCQGGKYGGFA